MRSWLSAALISIVVSVPAAPWAQESSEQSTSTTSASGAEPQAQTFDAEPLLNAMIALRSMALTCDPYVGGAPAERTAGIVAYFELLRQRLPDLSDSETQSSLNRFIGSQAAMLCANMLDEAFETYYREGDAYEGNRPEAWPAAPAVPRGQWCAMNYCLDQ